ncbi:MAG: AraC-like DNA-binding protein [Rubritalea sp.]|jgi:AraC-like DNA-binding protein
MMKLVKESEKGGRKILRYQHDSIPEWGYAKPQQDYFYVFPLADNPKKKPLHVILHSAGGSADIAIDYAFKNPDWFHYVGLEDQVVIYLDCRKNRNDWWWLAEQQETLRPEPSAVKENSKTLHHVHTAQEWIQQRLGENITIAGWSAACGLNTDYFSRLFKTHTGMTPRAWLIERRLQRACQLLASADETVEEVAYQCGFNCPFHFSRSFKRRFGIPPASYRRVRQVRGFVDS